MRSALPHLTTRWSALTATLVVIVTSIVAVVVMLGLPTCSNCAYLFREPPPQPPAPHAK